MTSEKILPVTMHLMKKARKKVQKIFPFSSLNSSKKKKARLKLMMMMKRHLRSRIMRTVHSLHRRLATRRLTTRLSI